MDKEEIEFIYKEFIRQMNYFNYLPFLNISLKKENDYFFVFEIDNKEIGKIHVEVYEKTRGQLVSWKFAEWLSNGIFSYWFWKN